MPYDDAARALFQVPHGEFVAERKRLAAELKAAGDKMAASRISRLQRPPVTAWAVNQLYWHARDAVDLFFDLAARLRAGDLSATTAHRDALAKLRNRAAAMLSDAGHGANEATLRRIALTLSAVAAAGTWMPDGEGMLSADRDPPGFDAVGVINEPSAPLPPKTEPVKYDFDAPAAPVIVEPAAPTPAPAPKRNAIAELAAKRKEMQEEEKRRRAAERRGEEYVPPEKPFVATAPVPSATPATPLASVTPIKPHGPDDDDDDDDDDDEAAGDDGEAAGDDGEDEAVVSSPRPRTLSIVPPLPDDDDDDAGDDDDDDDDIDTAAPRDESTDDTDDADDAHDNADELEAPTPATPKLSALEQLRARKKQQAEEAEEERRRKFMEDGGTREKVITKRMIEAQQRNQEASDAKRERVEAAVRAKLDAQRVSTDAQRAMRDAGGSDDEDDDDLDGEVDDDLDENIGETAPVLSVERGGRTDSPSKGPPQPSDLVNALAAKLGVTPKLSTGASPARTGDESGRPATPAPSPKLSTGASPARHVPENTKPPGSFPRPRTPSAESLTTPSASASSGARPSIGTRGAKPAAMTDAERRKIDARAKLKAELEARLRTANADVLAAEQRVETLTAELAEADDALEAARAVVEDLREKLDAID